MNQQENAALAERSARRALYSSLFSIVACAIMLFGTTFAWFTANQTSGVNTMTAANFDVSITDVTSDDGATHTVTLARLGGGTAPGYCEFKLDYAGEYTVTSGTITTTVDENGEQAGDTDNNTTSTPEHYSGAKDFYVVFANGTNNQSVTFRFSTQNVSTVSFDKTKVSWGEYPTTNAATPMKLMARRTFSAAPQPTVTQITDGAVLDTIGHEDVEDIKIETITIEEPAAGQAEENKNDEDGLKDGAKVNAGSGKGNENNESSGIDSNGGTDSGSNSGSGSGSGGSGSGAGGSTGESGSGEGGGNVSGSESSGGDSGSTGTGTGTGTDSGGTGSGSTGSGSTGNGDEA